MTFLEFLESPGELAASYLIVGEDRFQRTTVLSALRDVAIGEGSPDFNVTTLPGAKADSGRILDEARTPPFGAPRRMVVVEDADKLDKDSAAVVAEYLSDPEDFSTLVLLADKFDQRQKLAKAAKAAGGFVSLEEPKPGAASNRSVDRWIDARAKELGASIAPRATALLRERVGARFGALASEIDKLIAYSAGQTIGEDDVMLLVRATPAENIFALGDAVAEGRTADAIDLLESLPTDERIPQKAIGMLAWHFRRIWRVKCAVEAGSSMSEAMSEAGVPGFLKSKLARQVQVLTRQRLMRCFHLLLEADQASKSTSADPDVLLELLCVRLSS